MTSHLSKFAAKKKNCISDVDYQEDVPVIDLASTASESKIIEQIVNACAKFGFFQITSHGVPISLLDDFRTQMKMFFSLPQHKKDKIRRDECNARGYFDNELTKQRRDWKEALDVGVPGSRDWSLPDVERGKECTKFTNECLDGSNQFPDEEDLPEFRSTLVNYFEACSELADRIAQLMSRGISIHTDNHVEDDGSEAKNFIHRLHEDHTSYLRMNYYPPCPSMDGNSPTPPLLGISPHEDAGFLTVLVQDDGCHSLQVARYRQDADSNRTVRYGPSPRRSATMKGIEKLTISSDEPIWITIKPIPGALTINTGAMAQIWSNDSFVAPLHRVLTDPNKQRYSAPFFYNPGYQCIVKPLQLTIVTQPEYKPCNWGYFRAVRFAGDLTDLGAEIQISDYAVGSTSYHPTRQEEFLKVADFKGPFSVERYRTLLEPILFPEDNDGKV